MATINKIQWMEDIRHNVRNVAKHGGTKGAYGDYFSDTSMAFFFDSGKENPALAKIIAHDEIKHCGLLGRIRFFRKYYSDNFAYERSDFEDSFDKLYPETGNKRLDLINKDRVPTDRVLPKASFLERLIKKL